DVEDLAALVTARLDPRRGTLLHAAGRAVAGDLAGRLAAAGFRVSRAVLYDAEPATALSAATVAALGERRIAAAFFFPPRSPAERAERRPATAAGRCGKPRTAGARRRGRCRSSRGFARRRQPRIHRPHHCRRRRVALVGARDRTAAALVGEHRAGPDAARRDT